MAQRERGTAGARAGTSGGARVGRGSDRRAGRGRPYPQERTEPGLSGAQLAALRTRLRTVVEPIVLAAELDLEEFAITRAGRRFVVRVTVDGDSGVGHDELSDISRAISAALDAAEEAGGEFAADSYALEVSSPGVDRPLTLPRHWRRNVGRLVKVKAGPQTLTARVLTVVDAGVVLDGVAEPVAFEALGPGRVQIEFNRLDSLSDEEFGEEFRYADDDDVQTDDDQTEDGAEHEQEDRA